MKGTALIIQLIILGFCTIGFLGISIKLWVDSYNEWQLRTAIRVTSFVFFAMASVVVWCMYKLVEVLG